MIVRMTKREELTLELLKSLLNFDPIKGEFVWKVRLSPCKGAGDSAGSMEPDGYIRIQIGRIHFPAHKLAWLYVYGVYPKRLDHRNGIRSDNRISNLREATQKQNSYNRRIGENNTSGYKGVWKSRNRWRAVIVYDDEHIHLGMFDSKDDAARAYNRAAKRLFGEYACLNEVPDLFD